MDAISYGAKDTGEMVVALPRQSLPLLGLKCVEGRLAHSESLTAVFATLYYAVVAYGIEQAHDFVREVFDDYTDVETDMQATDSQ